MSWQRENYKLAAKKDERAEEGKSRGVPEAENNDDEYNESEMGIGRRWRCVKQVAWLPDRNRAREFLREGRDSKSRSPEGPRGGNKER